MKTQTKFIKVIVASFLFMWLAGNTAHAEFRFTKVVDNLTLLPGDSHEFTSLGGPVLAAYGKVSFLVVPPTSDADRSIYLYHEGELEKLVDTSLLGLGESAIIGCAFDGDTVAFSVRYKDLKKSVYTFSNGELRLVADEDTIIPGDIKTFGEVSDAVSFTPHFVNHDTVIFSFRAYDYRGFPLSSAAGLYGYSGGRLYTIVNGNTPLPDGLGNFSLGHGKSYIFASNAEKTVLFYRGKFFMIEKDDIYALPRLEIPIDSFQDFLFSLEGRIGDLQLQHLVNEGIVDVENELVYVQDVLALDIDAEGRISFHGVIWEPFVDTHARSYLHTSLYLYNRGELSLVEDLTGSRTPVVRSVIDKGQVLFSAAFDKGNELRFYSGGETFSMLDVESQLGGKEVVSFGFSRNALNEDSIGFSVSLKEEKTGTYGEAVYLVRYIPDYTVELTDGWNLIGGPSLPVDVRDVEASVRIWRTIFEREEGRFKRASMLEYGHGYYVYAFGDGILTLKGD